VSWLLLSYTFYVKMSVPLTPALGV